MTVFIEEISAEALPGVSGELAEILLGCVKDGASIGFVEPFEVEDARTFWENHVSALKSGAKRLFIARKNGKIVGTAQLVIGQPANQQHRADVSKVLVDVGARRAGIGRALMQHLDLVARVAGKSLLVLDTRTGDPSEALYLGQGFTAFGIVPGYAAHAQTGMLEDCTFFYKTLG
ncbi:GNAT family N-acetyltransferase [Lacibacterium aquatile]|uniref:GNAT family N-acetyltransferase n=1 Tax=Lacibacterium aquatile TaxID=1168082 RepID=A0ABW5DV36_9PROT